jgi:hypothetical protein
MIAIAQASSIELFSRLPFNRRELSFGQLQISTDLSRRKSQRIEPSKYFTLVLWQVLQNA